MIALKVVSFVIRAVLYIVDGNKLRFLCCHFTASILWALSCHLLFLVFILFHLVSAI